MVFNHKRAHHSIPQATHTQATIGCGKQYMLCYRFDAITIVGMVTAFGGDITVIKVSDKI